MNFKRDFNSLQNFIERDTIRKLDTIVDENLERMGVKNQYGSAESVSPPSSPQLNLFGASTPFKSPPRSPPRKAAESTVLKLGLSSNDLERVALKNRLERRVMMEFSDDTQANHRSPSPASMHILETEQKRLERLNSRNYADRKKQSVKLAPLHKITGKYSGVFRNTNDVSIDIDDAVSVASSVLESPASSPMSTPASPPPLSPALSLASAGSPMHRRTEFWACDESVSSEDDPMDNVRIMRQSKCMDTPDSEKRESYKEDKFTEIRENAETLRYMQDSISANRIVSISPAKKPRWEK